jgi:FtsP/CotA-like multicopper oxidase with cupredoxin domain
MMGRHSIALLFAAVGATAAIVGVAAYASTRGESTQVASMPGLQRGRALEEPVVLRSHAGRLKTTFTAEERRVTVAGVRVRGKSYRGEFIGPTLRVRPGDTLEIRLVNRLPEPTNLHTHGLHVSPIGISDNVLRTMPAGSANAVRVRIPRSLSPGTYWYHTHAHGLVEEQIFSGLAGLIVVEGLEKRLPRALRQIPDRVIALKDLQIRDGAIVTKDIDSDAPTIRTVNGLLEPVLRVRTNQTQLLRLANISADIFYRLHLDGTRFQVIAEDGNPVGPVWAADQLILPPGKRYDVLVRWPRPGSYQLQTLRYSTGPSGDTYPERVLATIQVGGRPAADVPWPRSLGLLPQLERARVRRVRHLTFSENDPREKYFINGRQFDASRVDVVAKLGTTEEWVIRNRTREQHPFHVHTNDFQVISINGRQYPARSLQDTVILPVHGVVRIRVHFRNFVGASVFHCHITAHEDHGMMGIVEVTRTGRGPSARTIRSLRALREEMSRSDDSAHLAMP